MAAVFVLPVATGGQLGPVAAYLSAGGWAAAAARVLGDAWVVCPDGVLDPSETVRRATDAAIGTSATVGHPRVPEVVKTLAKDMRQQRRAAAFTVAPDGPWRDYHIDFVWQRHELFHTAGLDLAQHLDRPSVLFVPATKVWEAERWGTRRPGWGRLLERAGEAPALRRADVVACGSPEVAEQATRLGVAAERIVLTPTGVDVDRFAGTGSDRGELRARLGLTDRFVVGWVGSFRPFHAIESAVEAVTDRPDTSLLMVGDGPERARVEALARAPGVHAVFTGTVAHPDLPRYLSAMDVGLVLAPPDGAFHYSPLKLAEYLASGLPVVAPAVEAITSRLTDGIDAVLVEPGDLPGLRHAIARLHDDSDLRRRIGKRAREVAEVKWSWDEQIRRLMGALAVDHRHPPSPGAST